MALVECGQVNEARRHAGQGDLHCAGVLVRALLTQGHVDAAEEVLRPFADSGHWERSRAG
jgi:hypothetical protein